MTTRGVDSWTEEREVEMIGLTEEEELMAALCGEDCGGAATETTVVDARDCWVVVGEFRGDFCGGN